ncbi:nuclear transport factor 2 family protein [Yinghuangia soli]|uniref:Nuclear transport factor 2 family protein n=1 Tax=Yinghuangia soli TaxID=2908204 RepID=A0AA41PVY3_9ACTN|nr:nuclear transport factor 2 family protein [Yinghuangia soli]MCF2526883.1 nuclear transport factor 2 family protein [Yinghuangia soli]
MTTSVTPATTAEIMRRFNDVFINHDPADLPELVADDCVMVSVQPAPEGTRYEGRADCVAFWTALASDPNTSFTPTEVIIAGDRATILWKAVFTTPDAADTVFGDGHTSYVLGVNVMRVKDGRITEALGYTKSP